MPTRLKLTGAIFITFFSAVVAQNQNDLKRAQGFYEKALQEKNSGKRVELLQKAVQSCASLAEAGRASALSAASRRQMATIYFALGREFYQQTKWSPAVAHLEKAFALDSTFVSAHATLGLIYFQQRKYDAAIAAYNKVLAAQPAAQLYNNLGAAHEAKGELRAAVEAYRRALELDARLLPAQKNLQRAQEKLALAEPVFPFEEKLAAVDSVQLAAPRRDSLALIAQKSVRSSITANSKERKGKPASTSKNSETKTKDSGKVAILKRAQPLIKPEVDPIKKPPNASAVGPPQNLSAAPTSSSSGNSIFAYLCGIGAMLLGVFAFTQRRRLNRVWLQIKPALAISTLGMRRQRRLLASTAARRSHDIDEIKFLPRRTAAPVVAAPGATNESPPAITSASLEPRQPSLQTQAFFAEMIAAEPEIEAFDEMPEEAGTEISPAINSTNGHIDSAAVALPRRDENDAINTADPLISATAVMAPISTINGKNGHPFLSQPAETSSELIVSQRGITGDEQRATSNEPSTLGRYLIEREIGKGAMGKIYLAFDPKLDRKVVIKTVCFNLAASETDTAALKDRVYREARAIARLGHPNIVVVYDVEDDRDLSYIVMEHIEGRDLRQALKSERRFDCPRAITIITQICSALDYAHQAGIIHRDIKPSNIMLLPNDKAKVTDFGIAKIADNFSLTLPGHVLGTPSYMAPEQFEGETIDGRADIFSLGVVLYELLTGCRPFAGDSLAALAYKIVHKMHIPPSLQNLELPLELDEIVGQALAKQPEDRFQTAQELRDALLAAKFKIAA